MRSHLLTAALTLAAAACAAGAGAQDTLSVASFGAPAPVNGWTFTPALGVSQQWDDNVLVQGKGDAVSSDLLSVLTPHAGVSFFDPRTTFSAVYDGSFELYRQFDSLNNYGQFETVTLQHKTTPRTSFFLQQQFSATPTTELPALVGVPFLRLGARIADARVGVDHAFTKRTTLDASYDIQWIAFDKDPTLGRVLIGGHGHTGNATLKHRLTTRTSLIADYEIQHAIIVDGSTFTVQSARAGAERKFDSNFTIYAEGGFAHVANSLFQTSQTSPSWRAGAARQFERLAADVSYGRAFVPAFGVGETLESQDFVAHGKAIVTRRFYVDGSADWRHDHPLSSEPNALGEAPLHSVWISALAGYTASPWLRVEAFFTTAHQTVDRPGGQLDRHRIGIQVTTTKPMRVR